MELHAQLLEAARKLGAGALGKHGVERKKIRHMLHSDPTLSRELLRFLNGDFPAMRSWAGTFVEQLFPKEDACMHLLAAHLVFGLMLGVF